MIDQKSLILEQFEKNLHSELIEFGKKINKLDSDIIVLMARKAVGLMDVIQMLGVAPSNKEIVSDRVLDLDISYFKGKKVALVDDTLIIGTTIRKAKQKLESNGINVEVHVFCADIDNWQPQIITPDSIQVRMSSSKVMSFCIAEVRAFSIISRPYLVDFPLTKEFKVAKDVVSRIFDLKDFETYEIPSQTNDVIENTMLTVYSNEKIMNEFIKLIGFDCKRIINNCKLRLFFRSSDENLYGKILPIVTLKAISVDTVDTLFNFLLSNINCAETDKLIVIKNLQSPTSKLRFIQYFFSYLFGKISVKYFVEVNIFPDEIKLDDQETSFHFGKNISSAVYNIVQNYKAEEFKLVNEFDSVKIPDEIIEWCEPILENSNQYNQKRNNVVLEFFDLFNKLYMIYELPARKRIKEWVKNSEFDKISKELRLNKGIPFALITQYFSDKYFLEVKDNLSRVLSIALDISNDYGISVPITCNENNVVFRAYRHGELGTRYNNDLFVKFLNTFLQSNQRRSFTHLLLEKLLVLFYRIGDYENMIDKQENLLKIGWDLMGAVMTRGTRDYFPLRKEDWLTDDLIKTGVISESQDGYLLTDVTKWEFTDTYVKSTHKYRAEELGEMFGSLYRNERVPILKDSPLDDPKLTLLASCTEMKDISMSIAAELKIFCKWFKDRTRNESNEFLNCNILTNEKSLSNELNKLLDKRQKGYHSFHQAYFKYFNAYKLNDIPNIILEVEKFGEENSLIPFSRKWKEVWENLLPNLSNEITQLSILIHQNKVFEEKLNDAILSLWEVGNWITFYEILINQKLLRDYPKTKLNSVITYYDYSSDQEVTKKIVAKYIKDKNINADELGVVSPQANLLKEKRVGAIIVDENTNELIFKILNIDNSFVTKNSQFKLEKFNIHFMRIGFSKEKFVSDIENYIALINDFSKPIKYSEYFNLIHNKVSGIIARMELVQKEIEKVYSEYGVTDYDRLVDDFIKHRA